MKLIDLDKMLTGQTRYTLQTILEQPVVEAIPIDFIKNYQKVALRAIELRAIEHYHEWELLHHLMQDWEKNKEKWEKMAKAKHEEIIKEVTNE